MRHQNSVFHELTKHLPWGEFDRLVEQHGSDRRVRRLDSRSQLLAMLFAQLAGAPSLRAVEDGLASQRARLYHLGAAPVARSTLSDANARRPAALFRDLFGIMVGRAARPVRRRMRDAVRILDATRLPLSGPGAAWATDPSGAAAAKVHLVYDPDPGLPVAAALTPATVNDITPATALEPEPGTTYVFDLAYYSFEWWARLDAARCRFVTRLKTNTPLRGAVERSVPPGAAVLADRIGRLPDRLARNKRNPFDRPIREVTVQITGGRRLRLATNDLDAPAEEIAALYRERWAIELFFKWIKQNLKIRHFLGTSRNAVAIQVYVALIAYLLLALAHRAQAEVPTLLAFTRLVKLNLMQRRPIRHLAGPPPTIIPDPRQLLFTLHAT
jgi:hypothetical protein